MPSFFSHGFGSGGSPTKKGKNKGEKGEEEKRRCVQFVDGRGQIVNCCCCQRSQAGSCSYAPPMQPVVGAAFLVPHMIQVHQPMGMAQQVVLQPAMPAMCCGINGVPTAMQCRCTKKKNKGKENGVDFWESFRDGNGRRFYKNSRTNEISYTDPLR